MRLKARTTACALGFAVLLGMLPGCSAREPADEGQPVSASTPGAQAGGDAAVQYVAPEGWVKVQPASSMRQAQFRLPKVEGDPEDAEMVAFYFGPGQGGTVDANVSRWISQFSKVDGSPAGDTAQVSTREVAGKNVTVVDVAGTYTGSSGPMMQGGPPKPDFRMLAAIIETPQGPWFYKLTGPRQTVDHWESSFDDFVASLRVN